MASVYVQLHVLSKVIFYSIYTHSQRPCKTNQVNIQDFIDTESKS